MSGKAARTSDNNPIRVDFVDGTVLGLPGRLGMTFAPGMKAYSPDGSWDRDLEADLGRLKTRYHADSLVTLLERSEFEEFGIPDLLERARQAGLEVIHFPIVDVSTPRKSQSEEYATLVRRIVDRLREGKTVVTHCRGGLGRTGTVAASVLVALGRPADEAIGIVRKVRSKRSVETQGQEEYVRRFEREWHLKRKRPGSGEPDREPTYIERYRGCLLGLAVVDALGTTLEFKPPGTFREIDDMSGGGPFGLQPGEWTDDTSMALCLAESLIEGRGFDPADQLKRYVRWYREGHLSSTGECFDIGNATRRALEHFEKTGEPYSGSRDPKKAGNGSIMRLAPVPLFYARGPMFASAVAPAGTSIREAVERSGESSLTTHGARAAVDACRYLGALIVAAVNGMDKEALLSVSHRLAGDAYWEEMPLSQEVEEVAAGSFKRREPPEIRGSGYVVRSLEAALWAFHASDSFEEGALRAVNLGDDADTTGAVYGQLAGAYYGERAIPRSWRSKLAHRLLIEHFAEQIFRLGRGVDWDKLLAYLPTFERPGYAFERETATGRSYPAEEVDEFVRTLYSAGIVYPFTGERWYDEAPRLIEDPTKLATADEAALRRLLTYHTRAERATGDHFGAMFESGHMTALLRRVRELRQGA